MVVGLGKSERGHTGTVTLVASLVSLAEDVQVIEVEIADELDCKAKLGQHAVPSRSQPDGVAMTEAQARRCSSTHIKWRSAR